MKAGHAMPRRMLDAYWVYRIGIWLVRCAPLGLVRHVIRWLAGWFYRLDHSGRESVLANLRIILGPDASEENLKETARQTFNSFAYYLAELGRAGKRSDRWAERIEFTGEEYCRRALQKGRGAILASAHCANWEFGMLPFTSRGYRLYAVVMQHETPAKSRLFNFMRLQLGAHALFTHEVRAMMRALKDNHLVAILADRPVSGDVAFVEMFGEKIALPKGAAKMSLRTGAVFLPVRVVRKEDLSLHVIIYPPLTIDDAGMDEEERMHRLMQAYATNIEAWIREHPSQWAAFYKAWEVTEKGLDRYGRQT